MIHYLLRWQFKGRTFMQFEVNNNKKPDILHLLHMIVAAGTFENRI